MNYHAHSIANRLSLRPPQRAALDILARICDIASLKKGSDVGQLQVQRNLDLTPFDLQ